MTGQRILLLGAGGHGKAIADLLLAGSAYDVVGFVDAAPKASQILGLPVLG
ncbi:MAG: transferase, partial [Alphaproteobacteria bacterium]